MNEAQRANMRNYINMLPISVREIDPLAQLMLSTPVMSNYKDACEDLSRGLHIDGIRWYSFQHQALFVLLHKLGLRGRSTDGNS